MAADTAVWASTGGGYTVVGRYAKIDRLKDGSIFACTGRSADHQAVMKWLAAGQEGEAPKVKEGFSAIWARRDSVLKIEDDVRPFDMPDAAFYAAGASMEFLLGSLAAGASAEEAVRLAIEYTDGAAGDVQVERLAPS
ncbi:MAG TPA: hypothetical protein VGR45_06435 [Stellaceae bacterium]|nr:hypothetical protein [Stellaceae bacterium]